MLTDIASHFVLPVSFDCIIVSDDRLVSNIYNLRLGIDLSEDPTINISLGINRIRYLVETKLQGSIITENNWKNIQTLDSLDNNVVKLPCELYDVFVGSVLMAKIQTITEKYFDILYLTVSSLLGDQIQYNILSPYDCQLELEGDHWWNQDNVYTGSKQSTTWDELNLTEGPKFRPTLIKGGLSEN